MQVHVHPAISLDNKLKSSQINLIVDMDYDFSRQIRQSIYS